MTASCVYKTADTTRANNTTLSDDPDLVITLAANKTYLVTFGLMPYSAAGVGVEINFYAPSATIDYATAYYHGDIQPNSWGATQNGGWEVRVAGGTSWLTNGTTLWSMTGAGGTDRYSPFVLKAMIKVGATGGNIGVQWAQTTSSATGAIMRAGSYIHAEEVAGNLRGVIKTADESRTFTAVLANDSELVLSGLAANATYIVDCPFMYYCPTTPQIKHVVAFTGTTTEWAGHNYYDPITTVDAFNSSGDVRGFSATAFNTVSVVSGGSATTTLRGGQYSRGILKTGSVGGDLALKWAQNNSASAASTIYAGAWLAAKRIQ